MPPKNTQVYHNYFERPELHTLYNRSGELWSPLVALATFFYECAATMFPQLVIWRAKEPVKVVKPVSHPDRFDWFDQFFEI